MEILLRCGKEHIEEGQTHGHPHDYVATGPKDTACPKCGNTELGHSITPRVRIHLLVKDDKGPIVGAKGRYVVACDPGKKALEDPSIEAWSDAYGALTCPQCLQTKAAIALQQKEELRRFHQSGGFHVPANFLDN